MQPSVRRELPDAIATCKPAGIVVNMMTNDKVHTAQCTREELKG